MKQLPDLLDRPAYTLTVREWLEINKIAANQPQQPANQPEQPTGTEIRGIHGLAKFLGVSPVTAQKLKNSGKIPYSQFGRVVLFDSKKVADALEK